MTLRLVLAACVLMFAPGALCLPATPASSPEVRRFAVVVGANRGAGLYRTACLRNNFRSQDPAQGGFLGANA